MFKKIIKDLKKEFPDNLEILHYYIERHIEVDGGHHSVLAYQMLKDCCGIDISKWNEVTDLIKSALIARMELWDSVYNKIIEIDKLPRMTQ